MGKFIHLKVKSKSIEQLKNLNCVSPDKFFHLNLRHFFECLNKIFFDNFFILNDFKIVIKSFLFKTNILFVLIFHIKIRIT